MMNSKAHYITLGGVNGRTSSNEAVQSLYNLTLVLPGTKLTDPEFQSMDKTILYFFNFLHSKELTSNKYNQCEGEM